MGAVYRARDLHFPKLVKLVAVKEMIILNRDPAVRQSIIQNFEREANLLATLHHPAIPTILDYFSQGDRSYLVMEFVRGENLEQILQARGGPLAEEQVINWGIELCDVLEFLHAHQPEAIIFRDMKPANVMVNAHNRLNLVDFGIAKHFQTGIRGTQVGTEGYSPPEQYRGDATPLADIYSLGASLHHLLTNKDPRLEAPFSFQERPVRTLNPGISIEMEAVINTALQYNPEDRFVSVGAMKEALLTVARRTGMSTRMNLGGSLSSTPEANRIKPLWTFECEDEVRGSVTFYKGKIYSGCYDNNLYTLNAGTGEFIWKYAADGGIVSKPVVDDSLVIFGSEDRRLHAISNRSGRIVWSYFTDGPIRCSARMAEGHVFIGSDDGYLHAVNIQTGRAAWRFETAEAIRSSPLVTSNFVYFGNELGEFLCLDFSGKEHWRFRAKRGVTSSAATGHQAVYFSSMDWTLYALDADNGWVLWRYRMGKPSIASPLAVDNYVIVGSIDGFVYAVDARNGKEVWRYRTESQVNGGAAVYNDALYIGGVDSHLYCLEYATGQLRWKFSTEGPITGTPAIFDGIVYFGSTDHRIYALLA